jgi:hypothetical protein
MKTELLLREAFERDEAGFEPASLDTIHGRVAKRRRRNRGALATAVIAVIAGIGLVMGPMQTSEPNAVFVSDDTGPVDSETAAIEEPVVALESDGEPSSFVPLEDPFFDRRRPDLETVVADGDGGFVGMFFVSAVDQRGPTTIVSRSATGEDWDAVGRWELGERVVRDLRQTGGEWMATLQWPSVGFAGPYGPFDPMTMHLEVALTADLENWTHHPVPLNFPERAIESPVNLEDVSITPLVMGGGRHEDTIGVQVVWFIDVAWELANDGCGSGRDERGVFLIRCDGSIDVVLDGVTIDALGLGEPEWYLGEDGDPLELVGAAPTTPVRVTPVGFVVMNESLDALERSTDGRVWEEVVEFGDPEDGEWLWALMADNASAGGSDVVVFGGSRESADTWVAAVDVERGDVRMDVFDAPTETTMTEGFINHGPAGWVAAVSAPARSPRGILQEDYAIVRWPVGTPNEEPFIVAPSFPVLTDGYRIWPSSELIEMGLFGELHVRRPGSDEVLFDDVSWRELDSMLTNDAAPVSAAASYEADGWSVSGDPFRGPLVITGPDGPFADGRSFADGFDFTNGNFDDGVELIGARADEARDASLAVFVGGEMVWSAPFEDILDTVVLPETDPDAAAQPGDAWVLRSDDGIEWEVAWSEANAGLGNVQISVGDDEVLIQSYTRSTGLRTIALDPDS